MAETPEQKLSDRVRLIGGATALLILVGWIAGFWPGDDWLDRSGTPWGGDFPAFYIAGEMGLNHDLAPLYDPAEHQHRLQELFPQIDRAYCLPYRYPPAFALVLAPWATLPYGASSTLFAIFSYALIAASIALLIHVTALDAGPWRKTVWWGAATAPVVLEPIVGGQLSAFAFVVAVGTIALMLSNRHVLAGAVLALALYKPNVLALFGLVCVLRYPRMLWGAIPTGLAWCALNVAFVGIDGTIDYLRLGSDLTLKIWNIQAPVHKLHGVRAWLGHIVPGQERELTLVLGAAAAVWLAYRWRKGGDQRTTAYLACSLALTINALFNPYVPIYDLSLLAPAALLMAAGIAGRYGNELRGKLVPAQVLIGGAYFGPHLSQAFFPIWGVQFFPLLLLVIAAWQTREFLRSTGDERAAIRHAA